MTRYHFADVVFEQRGNNWGWPLPSERTFTAWTSPTGTQITDLSTDSAGASPISLVTADSQGNVDFWGPDGVTSLYLKASNGNFVAFSARMTPSDVAAGYVKHGDLTLNVKDYGAKGDGGTDDTTAIQNALNSAMTTGATVGFPPGTYMASALSVTPNSTLTSGNRRPVRLAALGGASSRFGNGGNPALGSTIRRTSGGTSALLTIDGNAISVDGLTFDGNGGSADVVNVLNGFELRMSAVRVYNGTGIGLALRRVNNARFDHVMVDNCGSATAPAVLLGSSALSGQTNTVDFYSLTVERSSNVALQVGVGPDMTTYAEFIRFTDLHIEAPTDNGGQLNTDALVQLGNVRSVTFVSPFIYGGGGPLIEHNQQVAAGTVTYPLGGVIMLGGTLLGHTSTDGGSSAAVPAQLVHLKSGDGFALIGTRLDQAGTSAILTDSTYGASVQVNSPVVTSRIPVIHADNRTTTSPSIVPNDVTFKSAAGVRIVALDTAAGQVAVAQWSTANVARWQLRKNATAESGSNAGSDLELIGRTDAGANGGTWVTFLRNSGTRFENKPIGFYGTTPVARQTGTPAAATDATTTQALVNDLRTKLINLGLIS